MPGRKRAAEIAAEKWFSENGYSATVKRRLLSKTIYTLERGGSCFEFQLPAQLKGARAYLEMCRPILEEKEHGMEA